MGGRVIEIQTCEACNARDLECEVCLGDGYYIPIPDDLWEELECSIGDTISWELRDDGTVVVSKV